MVKRTKGNTQGKTWKWFKISAFPSLPHVFLCLFQPMHHLTLGRTRKENRIYGLKGFVEGRSKLDWEGLK
jgi:hypothetical protein